MPEENKIVFNHKEVVETLIKRQGIHEGIWRLFVEFGLAGGNVGPSSDQVVPSAILGVLRLGILLLPPEATEDALSVDAARVNPRPDATVAAPRRLHKT